MRAEDIAKGKTDLWAVAADGETPATTAEKNLDQCPAVYHMVTAWKAKEDDLKAAEASIKKAEAHSKENRRKRNTIVGTIAAGLCIGSVSLQMVILNVDTISQMKVWA